LTAAKLGASLLPILRGIIPSIPHANYSFTNENLLTMTLFASDNESYFNSVSQKRRYSVRQ